MVAEAAFTTIRDVESRVAEVHDTAVVSSLAVVGAPAEWRDRESRFPARILRHATVREFVRVHAGCDRSTVIGMGTLLMAGCYVGHDVQMDHSCEVAPNASIGGCCTIGKHVRIGMGATIRPGVTIGDNARIGMGSVVTKDVPAGETWVGNPARRMGPVWKLT